VNCNICGGADQSSWAADVSAGGWVGSRTKLGGELGVWRLGGDEATQRVMLLGAVSQIYPVRVPAFLKLGVGLLTYGSSDGEETLSATSFAAQAGVGFDVRVPGGYIVVPHATLVQGFNGGLYLDGDKVTGWSRSRSCVSVLAWGWDDESHSSPALGRRAHDRRGRLLD
jgi:hypothetical protein